jgi:hypothetical protein
MDLDQRSLERIAREFSVSEQTSVIELLSSYAGPESGRVTRDISELSKGSLEKIRQYVHAAQTDYRDILYWAEYYDSDPLLRGRDPKKMVEEIIAKWGNKKSEVPPSPGYSESLRERGGVAGGDQRSEDSD